MVVSLNKVTLIGNVGKDPEVRLTQEGKEIVTFPLATTENWKDKNSGERREKTEWHRVVVFIPALVNIIKSHVNKGSRIYIEGSLQTRGWNDQTGIKKYTTEIVLQTYNSTVILLGNKNSNKSSNEEIVHDSTDINEDDNDDKVPY
ncbi:single-stranded DNA-binding protein [Rickettsiales endosymbiont of Trichoplax sp. H2]|uniref:single-stranded DNA-binding protein n=1 Tax=Rickettsiales endosymbiont of Trichoplax sp. H2 TaxID=2021221 RepID=UPI0012B329D9|nr:single-stranded DNA-binding protein [Rickettsiales endosymbiont of Trichoplax sp. H2]MSO14340.1 Single-stranded DNA-binding protein [Rickettsiales endosymbiont of Trichoplax sp. H2]